MSRALFIVSAPSGSGKSTLVRRLLARVSGLKFSISYTTRAPRLGEVNGRDYFFVPRARFDAMVAAGDFLEHAEVFGNGYGTAWSFVKEAFAQGVDLVLDIDVQGARQVRQRFAEHAGALEVAAFATSIFIAPPNRETLLKRLNQRGLDAPTVIETRLRDASAEIAAYNDYDYVLINDRLEESVNRLEAIVRWERERHDGAAASPWYALAQQSSQERAAAALVTVLHSFGVSGGVVSTR